MDYGSSDTLATMIAAIGIGIAIGYVIWGIDWAARASGESADPAPKRKPDPAPAAEPEARRAAEPAAAAVAPAPAEPEAAESPAAAPPANLFAERPDQVDDLQMIKGIGPKMEAVLNERGVYQYAQLAAFTEADLAWLDQATGSFPGRAARDEWVAQAKALAAGG